MTIMFDKILNYAVQNDASDIHLRADSVPMVRVNGELLQIAASEVLSSAEIMQMLEPLMSKAQLNFYQENLEIDFAVQIAKNRLRANAFQTINGTAVTFRLIPEQFKTVDELNLSPAIRDLAKMKQGLVLVTGPTGSGKSTTLAALIDLINQNYRHNIITIEDPVEFIHHNKKSLITQREVGQSTHTFANALRSALREDPDVILVGEMRDLETIQLALTAAETGHLVFATLHTNSAAQTINRIIDVFPSDGKDAIRAMLAGSIKAIISQRLIKNNNNGRVAAYEIMLANNSIKNLIREDKIPQINSIIEINRKQGMLSLKDAINDLIDKGQVDSADASWHFQAYE